jgi:hypothetical protein
MARMRRKTRVIGRFSFNVDNFRQIVLAKILGEFYFMFYSIRVFLYFASS